MEFHSPPLTDLTFNKVVGTFSQTIFQVSLFLIIYSSCQLARINTAPLLRVREFV